ncbi:hypothetical protein [Nocardia fluminea]|uniref:hypothetical protein n=1 Tax=Nocardia fluminea TaxID=134984 RepID=UPI00342B95D7
MVDPIWAGVIGGATGSITTAIVSLFSPRVLWSMEERKLNVLNEAARESAKLEHRRALVKEWRDGLQAARDELIAHQDQQLESSSPELTGRAWFESLRTHLAFDQREMWDIINNLDNSDTVAKLSVAIADIEQRWGLV